MDRRDFLAASTAAAFGMALGNSVSAAEDRAAPATGDKGGAEKQLIEVRVYHFASTEKQRAFEKFLGGSLIPAMGRMGVGPVGVFKLLAKDNAALKLASDPNDLYVVLPYNSAADLLGVGPHLSQDQAFLMSAYDVLMAPKSDPAYTRYESSLLLGFDQCPRVEAPTQAADRLVQLRTYESHSAERAKKKIEMFNEGGEIAVFRRLGMHPVFFGQALIGSKLPNLTYMLAFENDQAQDRAWKAFRDDKDWKALSADEAYKDTVSNITNLILRPIEGSQI
jgi:hypothetical protein